MRNLQLGRAALFSITSLLVLIASARAQIGAGSGPPSTQPAGREANVPVREVVLFSSGVGYFEHFGFVSGNGSAELRFKTDQINDVLKSLLLQDLDGGKVATVSYDSQAPLAHRLKSFQVDITANPSMAELLNQLRGATITLSASFSKDPLTGIILGVEQKAAPEDKPPAQPQTFLNLKVGRKLMSVRLAEVRDLELQDPKLQSELDEALSAVAQARDQEKKPVTIHFVGQGDRRVRLGYVVETPVWKTSYRLVLEPLAASPTKAPTTAPTRASAKLQGWAIIENQTDNDWKDVQLSLMSGRPLSFIEDLYHSRYVPRPIVEESTATNPEPQTYEGGITKAEMEHLQNVREQAPKGNQTQGLFGGAGRAVPIDPTASIVAAASGEKVGELFQYTIGNVSIERQKSAMIPIVTDNISVEKLSIYNSEVLADHPLNGAQIKNTTHKHLLAGPVTVLDGGIYAGDARLNDMPPDQQRLVSYGIDQEVFVDKSEPQSNTRVVAAKIIKGAMTLTNKNVQQQPYLFDNKADHEKLLIVEQQRSADARLTSPPQADEQTPELYRFRIRLPAKTVVKFNVTSESVEQEEVALFSANTDDLAVFIQNKDMPQPVRDALANAMKMRIEAGDLAAQATRRQQNIASISAEQARLRENMKTVAPETDYYKRLLKKLDEQETEIEAIQKEQADLQAKADAVRAKLQEFISNLNIG